MIPDERFRFYGLRKQVIYLDWELKQLPLKCIDLSQFHFRHYISKLS